MPRQRRPFKIKSQEEGRGPVETESFATLEGAQRYIIGRWQGADYVENSTHYHTDFCSYELVGFTLQDIGKFVYHWYTDPDTGKEVLDWREFEFKDLTEAA
jgi:hypothetical protein